MLREVLAARHMALATVVVGGLYVHFRGRERHRLSRQLLDHSTIMAPYNALMYLFSAVKANPYADLPQFPELALLRGQWQLIREQAPKLFDEGYIRAAARYNDLGLQFLLSTWLEALLSQVVRRVPAVGQGLASALHPAPCRSAVNQRCDVRATAAGKPPGPAS
jgi:beta-hydroxylase